MITYIATNTVNGKFYIGSTNTDLEHRKRQHLCCSKNYPFQNALRANPQIFEWEVFEDNSDERVLEQALLEMFFGTEQCYNLSDSSYKPNNKGENNPMYGRMGENHPAFGRKHYEETIKTMSDQKKGENNPCFGLKWWINSEGETKYQQECPGEGWQNGRKWK